MGVIIEIGGVKELQLRGEKESVRGGLEGLLQRRSRKERRMEWQGV